MKKTTKLQWKVTVKSRTFNQAGYITDTMEGFAMQQTDFPFVCTIIDDDSKDGEQSVIREYLEKNFDMSENSASYEEETEYANIVFAQHKTNRNCYFAVLLLKENHYSQDKDIMPYLCEWRDGVEYFAFCEGDDYWIDPCKLQKQVDFLDTHPDYGMTYTNFNMLCQKSGILEESLFTSKPEIFPSEYSSAGDFVCSAGYVCPPSWVWRSNLPEVCDIESSDGTFVLFTHFLCVTKCHVLMDVTTTYRYLEESASHSTNPEKMYERNKDILKTQLALIDWYHLPAELKTKCQTTYYMVHLKDFVLENRQEDIAEAKKVLGKPSFKIWKIFAYNNPVGRFYLRCRKRWHDFRHSL